MTNTRMTVTGLKDLERRLNALEKDATKRTTARNALKAGGQVLADKAKQLAPYEDGDLRDSIAVSTKLTKRQRSRHRKRDPVEVFAGAGGGSNAVQQEYGNLNHAAQPYMRPAFDSQKREALRVIVSDMDKQIDKAIQRQAKRNAKKGR